MRLFIEPMEPLMFRTARPFDAGENSFAESLFPPTPETMQGAVRAAIAAYWHPGKNIAAAFNDPALTSLIGDRESYGRFRLTGMALGRSVKGQDERTERLFPVPAYVVRTASSKHLVRLFPAPIGANIKSNWPEGIQYWLKPEPDFAKEELVSARGWLTEADLLKVLGMEDLAGVRVICRDEIYQEEPRLGIGIDSGSKASREGFLYQMLMIRMNHRPEQGYTYGFLVDIDLVPRSPTESALSDQQIQAALHLPSAGWLTLGGEQRTAHFRVLTAYDRYASVRTQERSLFYLATPASFDQGWLPPALPARTLVTAAIPRYESIGGWKLNSQDARGENKVMRRCVPAGSVYFFQHDNTTDDFDPQSLTDRGSEIGYGITYKGAW